MSIHLTECAAEVQHLKPSEKLVLLCFADSGSAETRIAMPGLDGVMTWSGLGKSRALNVIRHLVELRLLQPNTSAHRGRRATYLVFPNGCCERHGKQPEPLNLPEHDVFDDTWVPPVETAELDGMGPITPDALPLSTGSGTSDPLEANGSDPSPLMGPISTANGSDAHAQNGSPPKDNSNNQLPVVTDLRTSRTRDATPDAEDLIELAVADTARFASGEPATDPCGHCDPRNRWIHDQGGNPVLRCPGCHPDLRPAADARAAEQAS